MTSLGTFGRLPPNFNFPELLLMQTLKKANIFACDLPRAVVLFYKIIRNRPNPDFLAIQGPFATTTDTAGIALYTVAVAFVVQIQRDE